MRIEELLKRDLSKNIEEIIKVDQIDEKSVHTEITEYVATESIKEQYRRILKAMAEGPSAPTEGVGIWISGFFGSGKSSFAKMLGYIIANKEVLGYRSSELFKRQVDDQGISSFLDLINSRTPTEVVMFDVSVDRAVRQSTEKISEVMYTVLLRELDYAEDYDIAELEIELEREGRLDELIELCRQEYGEWRTVRKGAQKISRASTLLHHMDAATYPSPDSWAHSLRNKAADITVGKMVQRAFDLMEARRPGKAFMIVIDEVGQYVARSADKIEDLRAVVEQFGRVSKNRINERRAIAPAWIVVTSQEKLDEVVAAIDDRRVELAKLRDRFPYSVDLAPADISTVATKRVLAKREDALEPLSNLYHKHQGKLDTYCKLERTARKSQVGEEDFIKYYPYLPHYIDLSIDIISGIRLQPGAPRHLGGSNRTMIKQAYEMLVGDRTNLAQAQIGTLVTVDKIYDLVEGNLSVERRSDINDIEQRLPEQPWCARVAKVICLLEFVKDLPRTKNNIAALLYEEMGEHSPLDEVEAALKLLIEHQFARETEEGFKLQTAVEKNWETERQSFSPLPREKNELKKQVLEEIFSDPRFRTFRYKELRNFQIGITVDDRKIGGDGQISLRVITADGEEDFNKKGADARNVSREDKNSVFWVMCLTDQIDKLFRQWFCSKKMIEKYEQLKANNQITRDEASCLTDEKHTAANIKNSLKEKLLEALKNGRGYFRGVAKDGADLGKSYDEILKKLMDWAAPDLYPKLEMGARPLKGTEAEEVLKAANLSSLSQIFYDGVKGLTLIIKQENKFVPNPDAEIAKEIMGFISRKHAYGEKVTGKVLEEHFQGIGYGWERDILRLVLAVLLRAGSIEVTHQGRRFRGYQEPQAREPFTNNIAFRNASFSPRENVNLDTLTKAAKRYEDLTGNEVDVEETAIADAFKKICREEHDELIPALAVVKTHRLPLSSFLESYKVFLEGVIKSESDDCVRILAGEGSSFKEDKDKFRKIKNAITEENIDSVKEAQEVLDHIWPELKNRGFDEDLAEYINKLNEYLDDESYFDFLLEIKKYTEDIKSAHRKVYQELHDRRRQSYQNALDNIKGQPEWLALSNENSEASEDLIKVLKQKNCEDLNLSSSGINCNTCQASLNEMESDLDAVQGRINQALKRLQELTTPGNVQMKRIRLAAFVDCPIESEQNMRDALKKIEEELLQALEQGYIIVIE